MVKYFNKYFLRNSVVFCKAVFKSDKLLKSHQKYLLANSYLKAAVDKFVFFARPLSKAKPHEKAIKI